MLRSRLADLMVFAGVLLVLAGVGLVSSVLADWEHANGSRRLQKLTVNVDRTHTNSSSAGLELKDADSLAKKWSPLPVALSAKGQTMAVLGSVTANCDVFGVNGSYRDFTGFMMISGSSITQTSVDEHSRVAVIGAELADRLFHSGQVAGKTIELYGTAFTVIGVYDENGSLLRQMSDDGSPDVLIPVTSMFDVNPGVRIDTVQLAAKPNAAIHGEAEATRLLQTIGKNPAQFRVENEVLTHARIAQLRALLLFGCGTIAILLLLRLIVRQYWIAYGALRRKLSTHDWSDAVWIERYLLLKSFITIIAMVACAAGLWELIRFRLYIPPDWVPEQVIDVSFYMDKLRSLWQQQAAQSGYVPSPQELLADAAGRLAGRLFFAGALLGLPIILLGVRLWALARLPVSVQLERLFLYIMVAAVAAFAAARWAGMDYRINPAEYAVTCLLFIVAIIHINNSKGVKLPYVQNDC